MQTPSRRFQPLADSYSHLNCSKRNPCFCSMRVLCRIMSFSASRRASFNCSADRKRGPLEWHIPEGGGFISCQQSSADLLFTAARPERETDTQHPQQGAGECDRTAHQCRVPAWCPVQQRQIGSNCFTKATAESLRCEFSSTGLLQPTHYCRNQAWQLKNSYAQNSQKNASGSPTIDLL